MECLFNQNKHKKLLINDNDTECLSDLIDCQNIRSKLCNMFVYYTMFKIYVQGARTASERDFSASSYTVWHKRNALLSRKVNMMMVLQQF